MGNSISPAETVSLITDNRKFVALSRPSPSTPTSRNWWQGPVGSQRLRQPLPSLSAGDQRLGWSRMETCGPKAMPILRVGGVVGKNSIGAQNGLE